MDKDSKFTRDEEGYVAVRVLSGAAPSANDDKESMFTRDEEGYVAVRVVNGAGGGGSDQHNKGYFATPEALVSAYPTAEPGDFAIVESTDTVWVWDNDTSVWKDGDTKGQVTSVNNQTGAVSLGINDVAPTQTDKSGYVLGTDGFVAGWVKPEIVQRSTMPQASEEEVGKIYQYVGTTDANYTNGYFYKCVSNGQTPATYSWENIEVQEADALPSQAGNAGKVLTTNGTDASWTTDVNTLRVVSSTTSVGELVLKASSMYYARVQFRPYNNNNNIATIEPYVSGTLYSLSISLANGGSYITFQKQGQITSVLSSGTTTANIGASNSKWTTLYVTKINNGSDITVPNVAGTMAVMNMPSTMPELTVAGWSNNTQTVTVMGVTATNTVFVSPAPASASDYASAGIICTAQGTDSLTFMCQTTPTNNLTVNVVILG